jgi:hemerythrin
MEIKMPLFTWDKKYSVNNEELDDQHKNIYDIFNRLYDKCFDRDIRVFLVPIYEELLSYLKYHRIAEEQYMASIGYRYIDKHISEHWFFKDRLYKQQTIVDIGDAVLSKERVIYLWSWFLNHVMIEDKKYSIEVGRRY